jgi:hypothetical protein
MAITEITEAGYESIRGYIENGWNYIELFDDTDTSLGRWEINSAKANWIHADGDQTLIARLIVTGADVGVGNTAKGTRFFETSSSTTILHTSDFNYMFTFGDADDQLTVEHSIEVPKVE